MRPSPNHRFFVGSRPEAPQRRRRPITLTVAAVATALIAAACGGAGATDSNDTLRWAWSLPDDSLSSETTVRAVEAIEASEAGISIDTYPNSTLVDSNQALEAVQNGSINIATASLHRFGTLEPALTIDGVPYVLYDTDQVESAVNGQFGELVDELMAEHGVKLVGWTAYGRTGELINTERPLETLSDLKGLRMRANGSLWGAIYNEYGAQGFEMSSGDVYTAIQSNTLDGAFSGINSILERDWAEVAPYITAAGVSIVLYPVIANLDWWNGLSAEKQEIIVDSVTEESVENFAQVDERYEADLAAVQETGSDVEIVVIDGEAEGQWQEDLAFVEDIYLEEAGENGQRLLEAYQMAASE